MVRFDTPLVAILASVVLLIGAVAPARACSNHGGSITGDLAPAGGGQYTLRLAGFSSFGYTPGHHCGCGLALPATVLDVVEVQFVDAGTNTPLTGSGTFRPDASVAATLATTSPPPGGTSWFGFKTVTDGSIAAGVPLDIVVTLQASPGASPQALLASLGVTRIGTGETNTDGTAFISHYQESPAAVTAASLPAAGIAALLFAGLGIAGAGARALAEARA
jgi:hypothetical protein